MQIDIHNPELEALIEQRYEHGQLRQRGRPAARKPPL